MSDNNSTQEPNVGLDELPDSGGVEIEKGYGGTTITPGILSGISFLNDNE